MEGTTTNGGDKKSEESQMRLPNDLILTLTFPDPSDPNPKTKTQISASHALVTFRTDVSDQDMINQFKFGYDGLSPVPTICMETGESGIVDLGTTKTILVDRPISPNSWVQQNGRNGFVTDLSSTVDVEIGETEMVIQNIPEVDIAPVLGFSPGQYVYLNTWIGCIKSVRHRLHVELAKGYECFLYTEQSGDPAYRHLHLKNRGDTLSFTCKDAQVAEWIKHPRRVDWVIFRYLNVFKTKYSNGVVLENAICKLTVSWFKSTARDQFKVDNPPPENISALDLLRINRLTLPLKNFLWYGMSGKYLPKGNEKVIDLTKWRENLLLEHGYSGKNKSGAGGGGDASEHVVALPDPVEENTKPLSYTNIFGDSHVIVTVIMRRATATVHWQDNEETTVESVRDLIPFHPSSGQAFPLGIGTIVRNLDSQKKDKYFKYGVVSNCDPKREEAMVKWLEAQSKGTNLMTKLYKSLHPQDILDEMPELNYAVGTIVSLKEGATGVVVGNDLDGKILVAFGAQTMTVYPYLLDKLTHVGVPCHTGELHWIPFRENRIVNYKHLASYPWAMNFGNVLPPIFSSRFETHGTTSFGLTTEPITPQTHRFFSKTKLPEDEYLEYIRIFRRDIDLLKNEPMDGIWIKTFEDRPDLLSVLMEGAPETPYEFGLFQFDFKLSANYPHEPPWICYVESEYHCCRVDLGLPHTGMIDIGSLSKYGNKRLDLPNVLLTLQETLFGVLETIDENNTTGGILPKSYSRVYCICAKNQDTLRGIIESASHLLANPPKLWEDIVWDYYKLQAPRLISRVRSWILDSSNLLGTHNDSPSKPERGVLDDKAPGYMVLPFDPTMEFEIQQGISSLITVYSIVY